MWDKELTAVYVEGVGLLIRPGAFEWFEAFDGSMYLCISDVPKGNARERIVIVGINVIGGWGSKEEAVV